MSIQGSPSGKAQTGGVAILGRGGTGMSREQPIGIEQFDLGAVDQEHAGDLAGAGAVCRSTSSERMSITSAKP